MEQPPSNKRKSTAGIIGFILAIAGLFTFGLAALPGAFFCIAGIIKKGHRILAVIGLLICLIMLVFLSAWTSPGSIPYPISIVKYCMNAPKFWIKYDWRHLEKAQSQYWLFGGAGGALYFESKEPCTFTADSVIAFAEENGWKYRETKQFTKDYLKGIIDERGKVIIVKPLRSGTDEEYEQYLELSKMNMFFYSTIAMGNRFPFWIQEDCWLLSFDTGSRVNMDSHVVINKDQTKMAVYYNGTR